MEESKAKITPHEEQEKTDLWKCKSTFSSPVHIAKCFEDHLYQDEQLKLANDKRDHDKLLDQKYHKMLKNLLAPVTLAKETPFVLYGSIYQLEACDLSNKIVPEASDKATCGLYLSGLINEKNLEISPHYFHGCGLTASPDKEPCVRNSFVFVGCDGQADGEIINYGDDVYIRILECGTDKHLFIQRKNETSNDFGGSLKLQLTSNPDFYCRFKVYHCNRKLRNDTVGFGFAPNSKVVIQHAASGQNLAAEYGHWIPTFFGAECIVSCHTYKNGHRMETAENIWKVVSDVEPDLNLCVEENGQIPVNFLN